MFVRQRDLRRHAALRAADIDERSVCAPGKLASDYPCRSEAEPRHGFQEAFEPVRVGVERAEKIISRLVFVLRLAGPERLGERSPEAIEAGVRHLEHAADVARFVAI